MDAPVVETPVAAEPEPVAAPVVQDPFALDEQTLASLSPEQQASVKPILDSWKKRAEEEISKRESSVSEKYKPYEEKAQALDKLTTYGPFVQWWQAQQAEAAKRAAPGQQTAIAQTRPQDIATPEEWQQAVWDASNGDSTKMNALQQRTLSAMATPIVQEITQRQQVLETQLELKDLFERHPDAKELDAIGIDPKTKQGISILEMALDWAEKNRKPLESGYEMARRWADSFKVGAQQQAMGMVQEKKKEITSGPSTNQGGQNVIEVADHDELLKRSMEATLSGDKSVRFVVKGSR